MRRIYVENLDTVNISMTISYVNDDIRHALILHLANGMLRHRFGHTPRSRSIRGPVFFAKQVMQKLLRDGKWVKRERAVRRADRFPPRRAISARSSTFPRRRWRRRKRTCRLQVLT